MKSKFFVFFAALAVVAGCSNDDETPSAPGLVKVEPLMTRASETNFDKGDKIGLYIDNEEGRYADNAVMEYDGSVFASQVFWYTDCSDTASLKAYYPYAASVPESFTVATDQTAGTASSDFIAAVKDDVIPTGSAIAMLFKHRLTKVVVRIDNQLDAAISKVVLQNSILTAAIDTSDFAAKADPKGAIGDITLQKVNDSTFQAILVPQRASLSVVVTVNGIEMSQRLSSFETLTGAQYSVNVTVLSDDITVSASGQIENWEDKGEIGSDAVSFEEFADHFVYDGVSYKTVKLKDGLTWMAEPMRFIPSGYTPSTDPTVDSGIWYPYDTDGKAETTAEAISGRGYLYSYDAIFGQKLTSANYDKFEGAQGICPKGWHVPSRTEFLNLCGQSMKAEGESGIVYNVNAPYYDETYTAGKLTSLDADGFNFTFSGMMMRNTATTTGKYLVNLTKESTCSVEAYLGKEGMNYLMSSTAYKPTFDTDETTLKNVQFFAMMTSFLKTTTEGKLNVSYANWKSGYQLRCVKNSK